MYVQSCQNLVKTKSLTDPRRGTDDTAENGRLGLPFTQAEQHQRLGKVIGCITNNLKSSKTNKLTCI